MTAKKNEDKEKKCKYCEIHQEQRIIITEKKSDNGEVGKIFFKPVEYKKNEFQPEEIFREEK